jgi:hypothetical protein
VRVKLPLHTLMGFKGQIRGILYTVHFIHVKLLGLNIIPESVTKKYGKSAKNQL